MMIDKINSVLSRHAKSVKLEFQPPSVIVQYLKSQGVLYFDGDYSDAWKFAIYLSRNENEYVLGGDWFHGVLNFGVYE